MGAYLNINYQPVVGSVTARFVNNGGTVIKIPSTVSEVGEYTVNLDFLHPEDSTFNGDASFTGTPTYKGPEDGAVEENLDDQVYSRMKTGYWTSFIDYSTDIEGPQTFKLRYFHAKFDTFSNYGSGASYFKNSKNTNQYIAEAAYFNINYQPVVGSVTARFVNN